MAKKIPGLLKISALTSKALATGTAQPLYDKLFPGPKTVDNTPLLTAEKDAANAILQRFGMQPIPEMTQKEFDALRTLRDSRRFVDDYTGCDCLAIFTRLANSADCT